MHIYMRTTIENEFPDREKRIVVSHVEFFPWSNEVEFFNLETKDHDSASYNPETHMFEYEGITYDFLNVYPFDPD